MQVGPGGTVGDGALRGGRLGQGRAGAAEEVEGGLGAVVASGGGHLVQVSGHLADDGAARAAGRGPRASTVPRTRVCCESGSWS